MFALTYPATFLLRSLPLRNSARLLRFTSSSARIGNSNRGTSRSFSYFARRTGSRIMAAAEEDRLSLSPARDSSHDSDSTVTPAAASAASVAPAPAPVPAGDGDGGSEGGLPRQQDGEWFRVSDSVKLALHRGDITNWFVDSTTDAIVNAANSRMLGGGGVDGAIHRKAGPKLKEACREVPEVSRGIRCPVGEARITPGFDLPASRVIHTVGPVYYEYDNPEDFLANAYRNSLKAAIENGIKYICFPAISCGIYSYPVGEAAAVSLSAIKEASHGLLEVHFVLFEWETYSGYVDEATKQFAKI